MVVCTVTMLGLKPWQPDESVPSLTPPASEVRVGDAVAVPTVGPAVAVVQAAVAPGKAKLVSSTDRSADAGKAPEGEGHDNAPAAVGPALAVVVPASGEKAGAAPEPAPLPESSPGEAPPAAAPTPELASAPAAPPSSSPPAKAPNGPIAVGSPGSPLEEELGKEEEACVGDEYKLTITPLEVEGEAVTIVLEHVATDGSTETLELEGDLEDARSLVLRLSSEGGCVEVEEVSPTPVAPPAPATP